MDYCIYLRKSRADLQAEQHGEGETLARHERALTDLAARQKLNIIKIYREIVSGDTIAARPAMQQLLLDVSEGVYDGVLVMDIDRLARGNSIDQGIIAQTFLYANTKIVTPAKTYDPANEFDQEYFEFGLFMARREYKAINRRMQRGREASVLEGKFPGNKAPLGYTRVKLPGEKGFSLEIVPEEAAVVRSIYDWYTTGLPQPDGSVRRIGVSLIAKELNRRAVPTKTGGVWTAVTVRDMLSNPTYIGKVRWGFRPQKKKIENGQTVIERPRETEYLTCSGRHAPIIDDETYDRAREIMAQNERRPIPDRKKMNNPLAGLVVCELCGRRMQRRPQTEVPHLLICAEPTCENHGAYLHLVEQRIIGMLCDWVAGYELTLRSQAAAAMPLQNDTSEDRMRIEKQLTTLNAQLNKAYEAFETGVYDAATFLARSETIKAQISAAESQLQVLFDVENQAEEYNNLLLSVLPRTKEILSSYNDCPDPAQRNAYLREIIDHVTYLKPTRGHGHEEDFTLTIYPKISKLYPLQITYKS